MAKSLWITNRNKHNIDYAPFIKGVLEMINPDHLFGNEIYFHQEGQSAVGILNPKGIRHIKGTQHILGELFEKDDTWWQIKKNFPEGTYCLFREDEYFVEILSDPLASRTLWYYIDDQWFVASSSQRAILLLIGGFQFNEKVIPWMFSSGSLGPSLAWDKRVSMLAPDSRLSLDKNSWELQTHSRAIQFSPLSLGESEAIAHLKVAIGSVIGGSFQFHPDWVLPISGGVDSRGLLFSLLSTGLASHDLRTLTRGGRQTMNNPQADYYLGNQLANLAKTRHETVLLNKEMLPFELIWERFLTNGEGRVDNITGYVDGFGLWKGLYDQGIKGMLRADEAFGQGLGLVHREEPDFLRYTIGLSLCKDFSSPAFRMLADAFPQDLPPDYLKRGNETWFSWRDRIYQEFRMPIVMAALTDLKTAYLELANPFLSRVVLQASRSLPDMERLEKKAFRGLVDSYCPQIPYASTGSGIQLSDLFESNKAKLQLMDLLHSSTAFALFPQGFNTYLSAEIRKSWGWKVRISKMMEKFISHPKSKPKAKTLDSPMPVKLERIGLRAVLLVEMYERLSSSDKNLQLPR